MTGSKATIIARLQRDILSLQGFKTTLNNTAVDHKLGSLINAFPGNTFALGAMHEFIYDKTEDAAATTGFIAGIVSCLMQNNGVSLWIGGSPAIFPPALKSFGIAPDKIIFIDLQKKNEMLWAMEEALKCDGLAAVIGELPELSFTISRRLQLAVEKSHVTGFILHNNRHNLLNTACVTRWKITALPSQTEGMPGIGFPRWNVELQKVRSGRPGNWQIEFRAGYFRHIYKVVAVEPQLKRKTG